MIEGTLFEISLDNSPEAKSYRKKLTSENNAQWEVNSMPAIEADEYVSCPDGYTFILMEGLWHCRALWEVQCKEIDLSCGIKIGVSTKTFNVKSSEVCEACLAACQPLRQGRVVF